MDTGRFNPLDYPLCLQRPERLTDITSWHEHIPFAFALVQMLRPRALVELGTHKGDSYCAFCQAVATLQLPCFCTAVDTWKGDEEAGFYGPEVLDDVRSYHDPRYGSFSRLKQCQFDEALPAVPNGSIDLLHIDGLHTYEAVRHDYETWLPKVSGRGVILFHDIAVRDQGFGAWRLWQEVQEKHASFAFDHGHGLGMLGVGKETPSAVASFLALREGSREAVRDFFSVLGSRLTAESRFRKELAQLEAVKEKLLEEVRCCARGMEAVNAELKEVLAEREKDLAALESRAAEADERIRELEAEAAALKEENSHCRAQAVEFDQALAAASEQLRVTEYHVQNLERIVSHPVVRLLRRMKKVLRVWRSGDTD